MSTSTTTWRIPPAAWVAISAAAAAEATSNALRAYGLGMHLEAFTLTIAGVPVSVAGAVLVLAAIAVTLTQTRAAWVALTPGDTRQRIVCGAAALLLLSISVTAMVSHVLEAQRAKVSDESGERGEYDRGIGDYATLITQRKALAKYGDDGAQLPRDAPVVQAAIDRFPIHPKVWRRSKQCTDITEPDSRLACQPILDLREELGAHAALVDIERKTQVVRDKLATIKRPEEVQEAEAWLAGKWAWIMGLGVVFIATFGPVIFAKVEVGGATVSGPTNFPELSDAELIELRAGFAAELPEPNGSRGGGPTVRQTNSSPKRPNRPGRGGFTKDEAAADLVTRLALGERFASQDELAERYGIAKSTASEWVRDWEGSGLIPARTQAGRCKALASN